MAKRILDTQVLINHWHRFDSRIKRTPSKLREHARELIEMEDTNLILSPVLIEFLCGAGSSQECELFNAYLKPFEVLDDGKVPRQDWEEAKRLAQWSRGSRKRKLGDCLIEAIARRLNADVVSRDRDFRGRVPPND